MAGKKKTARKRPGAAAEARALRPVPGHDLARRAGPAEAPLTVVGIGMSAGGFEACLELLHGLPAKPGFAVVIVQHLAPDHTSELPRLLASRSPMPVLQAEDGIIIERDHAYVIPPNALIELEDGRLRVTRQMRDGDRPFSIDYFLESLAFAAGERAIGVLLSGMGSDGVEGVRALKAHGGTVLVQAPESARFDPMPRAAIGTGLVDDVLPPAAIARKLVEIASHPFATTSAVAGRAELNIGPAQADELHERLREASGGVDFSHYKQPTIKRRLLRRMALNRVDDLDAYLALLRSRPDEARGLYQDLLIQVTRFFREPDSFAAIAREVAPSLLARGRAGAPLRAWVAGCATGEEAYSLAMTLLDAAGEAAGELNLQIFGTDVSDTAVEVARQGLYPVSIAEAVPAASLRRYFARVDGGYRVSKQIRDRCIFARQDLTRDPPFSKLDLILCRNVLIYLDAALQRKLLPVFHYALRPDGYLVLGHAETVGAHGELFALVDKTHRIFRKRPWEHPLMPATGYEPPRRPALSVAASEPRGDVRLVQSEASRVMLERFSPPGVVVNAELDIVQFRGKTGAFLEPAPGDASFNLLKLAREGLLHGLRGALQAARKSRKPVRRDELRVRSETGWTSVDLEVIPLSGLPVLHFVVLFHARAKGKAGRAPAPRAQPRSDGQRTALVEQELAATREYLQSIIQEVEAANEELQSANEEILSSNEELQSTNEELDTAKEELQSTNEELNTLNDELHARNEELTRVNSDLVNLLGSVQIAIVIVSNDLRIRRFTPAAEKVLNLIPADVGRPITQLRPNIDCPDLGELLGEVVDRVATIEREVKDQEGRWYSLRLRPYKGIDNKIEGAIVALVDIDAAKRHELEISRARAYAEAIVEAVRHPLVVLDGELRVRSLNQAFAEAFRVPANDVRGRPIFQLDSGQWNVPELHELLERVLLQRDERQGIQAEICLDDFGPVWFYARSLDAVGDGEQLILLGLEQRRPQADSSP